MDHVSDAELLRQVTAPQPSVSALQHWAQRLAARGSHQEAAAYLRRATVADPHSADLWLGYARAAQAAGDDNTALTAYHRCIQLQPALAAPYRPLTELYLSRGQTAEAASVLADAVYHLRDAGEYAEWFARLDGAESRCSQAFVRGLFDRFSATFETKLTQVLQYQTPQLVRQSLLRFGQNWNHLIDLGCGTGLLGVEMRPFCQRMDGLDLSPKMLALARQKSIYDTLAEGDAEQLLQGYAADSVDLVGAADVMNYLGDLTGVVAAVHRVLRAGGLLVFSVELAPAGLQDYGLSHASRFQHSATYAQAVVQAAGFELMACDQVTLRMEDQRPVAGAILVAQK